MPLFSKPTVAFFRRLEKNNNWDWFGSHRDVYKAEVMAPARLFIMDLGARIKTIAPNIVAIPEVNKSIFRIHRNTGFSLDPSPYKTKLGLYFWVGAGGRMERSRFYFHLESPDLMLGGDMCMFPDKKLLRYRKAVVDKKLSAELAAVVREMAKIPWLELGGKHYKRVPAGFDPGVAPLPQQALCGHGDAYPGGVLFARPRGWLLRDVQIHRAAPQLACQSGRTRTAGGQARRPAS
ncbi:DUF2461 domain-containing protein [bacterium]|nr:MAG: DUF2461 domain-containing protein [bacterium]